MALYSYQGLTRKGKNIKGQIDAPSIASVKEQLNKKGIFPSSITLAKEYQETIPFWKKLLEKKVTTKDKILFTKQLSVLLKSGIPLLQALDLLIDQFEGQLKLIILTLRDNIKEGKSLAEGLSRYSKIFDSTYIQLVRAGEASGKLEVILERLTEYLERRNALAKRIKNALTYPIIQITIIVGVVIVLLTKVVPKMSENFTQQGAELPATTRMLQGMGSFLTTYYIPIIIILFGLIVSYKYWKKTDYGSKKIDQIKLKLPIIKTFTRTGTVVQFCQTLGMLLEGGVNLGESLDIVYKIINNKILAEAIDEAREKIIKQGKISQYLKQTNIFPPIAIYLIKTGEESGQLDKMLLIVAKNYEEELTEFAENLSSKIEPIMIIVMAFVVGFVVLSIVQPIAQMSEIAAL